MGAGDGEVMANAPNDPQDIRDAGWSVAVHNDYRQGGEPHTFWLFTKDGRAVKGEGSTDAEALARIREQIAPTTEPTRTEASEIQTYTREWIAREENFGPLSIDFIRDFYATVLESSEIDMMIGATFAEFLLAKIDERDAELLRFAGPECPHDGKRAIEHGVRVAPRVETPYQFECVHIAETHTISTDDGEVCPACHENGIADPHPTAPDIEDWLRRNV